MKNKICAILLVLALFIGVFMPAQKAEASSFPASLTIRTGAIYTFRSDRITGAATWTSSKNYVASISTTGVLTAKDPGTTTIKAVTSDNKSYYCKVTVKKKYGKKGSKYNPKSIPTKIPKGLNFTYYMEGKEIGTFNIQITSLSTEMKLLLWLSETNQILYRLRISSISSSRLDWDISREHRP